MKVNAQKKIACIILAAGKGTRMKSLKPKVMHAIAHKPMVQHVIDTARAIKAEKIVMVTSPDMGTVRDAMKRHYKDVIENAVQQEQRGTADAVKAAKQLKDFSGTVFILYGDTPLISSDTLHSMSDALKKDPKLGLVVLGMEVDTPNEYGRLVLDAKGDVERIVEAKDANAKEKTIRLCNSGVMAVRGKLLFPLLGRVSNKNAKKEYYLTDIVALARKDGHRCGVISANPLELLGVNSRAELAVAEATIQQRLRKQAMSNGVTLIDPSTVFLSYDTKIASDVIIHPHVIFGPGVEVESDVEIRSFCHIESARIDKGATVGPFARLRPGAHIGASAHIGNFVEIKKAKVEHGAKVNHLSYIGDAYVGANANIGAGTITCNYDGFGKHHTDIGAGAFIGSNTSLVAPVTIGEGAVVGAGSVITDDVEPNALALTRSPQKQKPGWAKALRHKKSH
jgi:bifunctional UDP-N-acetylglucosamine pyrophosphorylase/glucosamine-1-phosphate N-acetyltransferase